MIDKRVVIAAYLLQAIPVRVSLDDLAGINNQKLSIKLGDLVKLNSRYMKKKSGKCVTRLIRSDLQKLTFTFKTVCGEDYSDASGHVSKIRLSKKKTPKNARKTTGDWHCLVSCSCPAFQYWGPGFLAERGNHQYGKNRTDGSPPKIRTNMSDGTNVRANMMCKHLQLAAVNLAKRKLRKKRKKKK